MRLRNAFKNSGFETPKLVTTKTLLLKHYYRRQGNQVGPYLSKICRKFENLSGNCRFSSFRQIYFQIRAPLIGIRKKQPSGQMFDKFGVRGILNAVRGRRVCKARKPPLDSESRLPEDLQGHPSQTYPSCPDPL